MSEGAILCIGRLYCDLIFTGLPRMPELGTELFTNDFSTHAGGGAFITAAHLADLGFQTHLAAMLPAAPYDALIQPQLAASELDLSLCKTLPPEAGAQITVALSQAEDRAFVTRRAGPAIPALSADDLAARNITHLHVGELASAVENPELLIAARARGITLSVDCGWDEGIGLAELAPLAGHIDLFLPNETELKALKNLGLSPDFAALTVVKRGARGASALTSTGPVDVAAAFVDVVDATGAGDAFNAGFIAAWLAGQPLDTCLMAGNARGGQTVQHPGGFNTA